MKTYLKQLAGSQAVRGDGVIWNDTLGTWQAGETKDLAGFENRTDSTLAWNDSLRMFTISGTYSIFLQNIKHTKSVPESIIISNTVGLHYILFDSSGNLASTTTPWDMSTNLAAPIATVYWSGTAGELSDERHSYKRDRQLHKYLHHTRGAALGSGLSVTFTDTSFSAATGYLWDEDIQLSIVGPITSCRLWYRNTSNQMQFESGIATPYKITSSILQYDNAGTLTDVPNNSYTCVWVYATNAVDYSISVVVGQSQGTLTDMRAAPQPTLPNMTTLEWKLLYRTIYRRSGTTPIYIESTDYRTATSLPSAVVTSLPAASVTVTPSGHITSTDVQTGLIELDTLTLHLSGDETLTGTKRFDAKILRSGTDSSGTPGAATINKPSGISAIASGASTCVITNSLATTTSLIHIDWYGDHGAARSWVVRSSGSFTVTLSSNATADTSFGWTIEEIA